MRNEKALINLLQRLVHLLADESKKNPEFANKVDSLLIDFLPSKETKKNKEELPADLPDIYTEWQIRDEIDFGHWLQEHPLQVLKALIRKHDFDAKRQTEKWKDPAKLVLFINEKLRSRATRGNSFLRENIDDDSKENA